MQPEKTHNAQRGASTVELALILPVLLLVLFAIVEYGRFFYLQSMAASVTADAVRQASLPGATDSAVTAFVVAKLNNGADGIPPGFDLGVTPTVSISPPTRTAGNPVTVTLRYPYVPLILPQMVGETLFPANIFAGASAMVEP